MRALVLCLLGGTAAFLTLDHAVGSSVTVATASVAVEQSSAVNRAAKGDRLRSAAQQPVIQKAPQSKPMENSKLKPKLPDGCEPMVSPLTGHAIAKLPGRCVA
jgi:hypothetical protein